MKTILALIKENKQIYSQSPLFRFMEDIEIHPVKRLAFAPVVAPFIMSFADLCKYVLRRESANDEIQALLNQHTYEDDSHWQWFLEDLHQLGFNRPLDFNNSLEFLWSEETWNSRFLSNELYRNIAQSEAWEKWIILEVMEAAADVFFSHTKKITQEIHLITNQEFKYFGNCHFDAETDHTAHSEEVTKLIENIRLTEEERQRSTNLVKTIFSLFDRWNLSLLEYAQSDRVPQIFKQPAYREQLKVV